MADGFITRRGGVSEEPTFNPSTLNPQLWLDAADASTITASNGNVSQWANKGSLNNFIQNTSNRQPKTGVSTLNGLNVIDFNSHWLDASNQNEWKFLHDGTKYEIFAVWRPGNSNEPGVQVLLDNNNGGEPDRVGITTYVDGRSTGEKKLNCTITRGDGIINQRVAQINTGENNFLTNNWNVHSIYLDPSNSTAIERAELRIGGSNLVKNNTLTGSPSTSNPTNLLRLGAVSPSTTAFPSTSSFAEIIIISGNNVTNNNRRSIVQYLYAKWSMVL
jgi:hypothetical protein